MSAFLSYAENGEDVVLHRALQHIERGRYIDVGAGDPTVRSNSRAFYERGWRGLDVDQVEEWAYLASLHRPEDVTNWARVLDDDRTEPSAEDQSPPVHCLTTLLSRAGWPDRAEIHFLSVDCEGTEEQVLRGFDFRRWRPWIVVVDATLPDQDAWQRWEPLLTAAGYSFALFDGLNRFYVANERAADLAPTLAAPACVLDDHVTIAELESGRRVRQLRSRRDDVAAQLAATSDWPDPEPSLHPVIEDVRRRETAALAEAVQWRLRATQTYRQPVAAVSAPDEPNHLRRNIAHLQGEIARLKKTVSWRVTAPLRLVRRLSGRG